MEEVKYKVIITQTDEYYGEIDHCKRTITINSGVGFLRQKDAYIHECMHAYERLTGNQIWIHQHMVEIGLFLLNIRDIIANIKYPVSIEERIKPAGYHIIQGDTYHNERELIEAMLKIQCYYLKCKYVPFLTQLAFTKFPVEETIFRKEMQ